MSRLDPTIHPSLTQEVIDALQTKHIFTVLDFIKIDIQQITNTGRLNFREALAIRRSLIKKFSASPLNGYVYYKTTLRNTTIISTGIKSIDHLLGGGLFTGQIYEICGLPASGKTHFSLNLTKNTVLTMDQKVFYLDTKNDFTGTKMKKLLGVSHQETIDDCLKKIMVKRTYTIHDLINSLHEIKNTLIESEIKLRLIIIDSLPSVVLNSTDYAKNSYLNHLVNIMRYIAEEYQIVFLVTNLLTIWNEGDFKNQQRVATENITCGRYWYNVPSTRLKIEKQENGNLCTFTILNSGKNQVNSSVSALLSEQGFE